MPIPALRAIARSTGNTLATLEKYWKAAKKQARQVRTEGTPSFYRYVMKIVKEKAGVNESVTDAESLLIMTEDFDDENASSPVPERVVLSPEQENYADSILDENEIYVPLDIIRDEVVRTLGEQAREPFMALLAYKSIPADKKPFIEFFRNKTDMASKACYKVLIEDDQKNNSNNQTFRSI